MQIGFRTKRIRPQHPMYFDLHPALHSLTKYSTPKNTTRHISCKNDILISTIEILPGFVQTTILPSKIKFHSQSPDIDQLLIIR